MGRFSAGACATAGTFGAGHAATARGRRIFAAARDDALAPPSTLLAAAAPMLLAFFDTRSVLALRTSCTEARAAVAAMPWDDASTPIFGRLAAWRACFPAARAAKHHYLTSWRDADFVHLRGIRTLHMNGQILITDAALVNLPGIHTLNMSYCGKSITDAAFVNLRGIHTLDMSYCSQPSITDATFDNLRGIHTLNMSMCTQPSISDAAFVHLRGIHTLNMSNCRQRSISDAAFVHLRSIHSLSVSGCSQPGVTDAAFYTCAASACSTFAARTSCASMPLSLHTLTALSAWKSVATAALTLSGRR